MDARQGTAEVRPWTVYVLVVVTGAAIIVGLILDGLVGWGLLTSLLELSIAYALWQGRRWAFTLSFMLATLCFGLVLVVAGIQVVLFEEELFAGLVWGLVVSALWIALLLHPATKGFAGLDRRSESEGAATG